MRRAWMNDRMNDAMEQLQVERSEDRAAGGVMHGCRDGCGAMPSMPLRSRGLRGEGALPPRQLGLALVLRRARNRVLQP